MVGTTNYPGNFSNVRGIPMIASVSVEVTTDNVVVGIPRRAFRGLADSKARLMNTISHEIKHVQSNICQDYNVNEDSEDAAYLTGYITMRMYEVFRNML